MQDTDFETDELLKLLTEALRAGPGSPAWHEAVTQLRSSGSAEADEYRLLIAAREDLESGREYRSVRAGAGFTRKLMQQIDEEGMPRAGAPSANLVALIATGVILAVVFAVGFLLMRGGAPEGGTAGDLRARQFGTPTVFSFSDDIPAEWKTFGVPPEISGMEKGLRGGYIKERAQDYSGGGIVAATAMRPDEAFGIEATVRVTRPTSQVVMQLFVTEEPQFEQNVKATTPREFVMYIEGRQVRVAKPDGSVVGGEATIEPGEAAHLLIKVDRRFAVVEVDGKVLYADASGLSGDRPRWPGVRFLTKGTQEAMERVTVQSIRIMRP